MQPALPDAHPTRKTISLARSEDPNLVSLAVVKHLTTQPMVLVRIGPDLIDQQCATLTLADL
jgi:hypothetical protein